ncbi:amidohydrolase family protein [Tateyamaria sp.]|uniref:amidohydrolase family protein n=1 Tax=Tateyamaria sp. TaxID=1929288 RepID=UPI00329BFC5F
MISFSRIACIGLAAISGICGQLPAKAQEVPERTLFTNVSVYDGVKPELIKSANVLVEGKLIKLVSTDPIEPGNATIIDGGGRTLTPGLMDTHVHLQLVVAAPDLEFQPVQDVALQMVPIAEDMLMRGFTTVRDACGNTHGLRRQINAGTIPGPRIVSAGACIGGWSSHADFMTATSVKGQTNIERIGFSIIADGPDQIREAIRREMRQGASFIKLMVGGGLASAYDPLDTTTWSYEEIEAAVDEAKRWGTYATAHLYTDESINLMLDAGAVTLEHMHLASEATMRRIAEVAQENDSVFSAQVAVVKGLKGNPVFVTSSAKAKAAFLQDNGASVFELMREQGLRVSFGVDSYGSFEGFRYNSQAISERKGFFSNDQILEQVFQNNARLIEMTGERNPYKDAALGVIAEGAWADILLVEGDPTQDVSVFSDWENNIDLVMKDGVVYRSELD